MPNRLCRPVPQLIAATELTASWYDRLQGSHAAAPAALEALITARH
jgi:hypothetical protein